MHNFLLLIPSALVCAGSYSSCLVDQTADLGLGVPVVLPRESDPGGCAWEKVAAAAAVVVVVV